MEALTQRGAVCHPARFTPGPLLLYAQFRVQQRTHAPELLVLRQESDQRLTTQPLASASASGSRQQFFTSKRQAVAQGGLRASVEPLDSRCGRRGTPEHPHPFPSRPEESVGHGRDPGPGGGACLTRAKICRASRLRNAVPIASSARCGVCFRARTAAVAKRFLHRLTAEPLQPSACGPALHMRRSADDLCGSAGSRHLLGTLNRLLLPAVALHFVHRAAGTAAIKAISPPAQAGVQSAKADFVPFFALRSQCPRRLL
jgi:hypothetical protein